jgi:putative ABC transport system permease protein
LLRVTGSQLWVLLLEKTEDTQTVVDSLRSTYAGRGLEFVPWTDLADFYNKTVVLFRKQVGVIEVIIGMIIILTIANSMMMNIAERTGEIGTAMAVGVTRAIIMRQFLLEGLLLGIIGGVVGLVVGGIAAYVISMIGIPMPPPPGMARGYIAEILLSAKLLLNAFLLAIVTALLASIYPAWRASRLQIVDALRFNR